MDTQTELTSATKANSKMLNTISINYSWCKKCGICIAFCPKKVYKEDKLGAPIVENPENCNACQLCALYCPDYAINVTKKSS